MVRVTTIARKELTELLRDGRFRWAAGIVFALLAVSLVLGWSRHVRLRAERDSAQTAMRHQWLDQGEKNPHSAAHFGIYAFRPQDVLALFDQGIDPYVGTAVWLEAHKQNHFGYKPSADSTLAERFGQLTAAMVLQALLPLVLIALAFSSFAGEQEQGTMRQLLSLGIPRGTLAAGKAAGVAAALGLLAVPAAIAGGLSLAALGSSPAGSAMPRVLLLAAAYSAYLLTFVLLALAISAMFRSSRPALLVLLALWTLNLLAPRLASDTARRLYPTPSSLQFSSQVAADMRLGIDGHNPEGRRADELKQRTLAKFGVNRIEDLPVNFSGIALQEGEEYGYKVFDRRYAELWGAFERQNAVHLAGAVISPLLAMRAFSMGLAGTDWSHHRHFAEAAESYRRMMVNRMNHELIAHGLNPDYSKNARGRELWEQIPDFSYSPPSLSWVLTRQTSSLVLLMGWLGASCLAVVGAIGRLRVS
jgi:ABC-2 type transport system permease protein